MGNTTSKNTIQAIAASRDDRNNITTTATASYQKRNPQNYTLDVNKQLDHSSADNCTAQHSDIQHAARDQRRALGHEVLVVVVFQAVHKVTLHLATVISADRPVEGIPRDTLDDAIASSTGNSLQLTSDEALTDAPDSGSVRSIQSRLGQFAYTGSSQDTMDHE